MKTKESKTEYVIDAASKRLGNVATEAASLLIGKNSPSFVHNVPADVTVKIVNARLMDITAKKAAGTEYQTYSGYPGGQKRENLAMLSKRRGYAEALRRTVSGMLPKNKLRTVRLKNLVISE